MEEIDRRIGFQVRQLMKAIKKHGEQHGRQFDSQNISMLQRWIICYLANHEDDVYQKDLERQFHIGKSTLTEILHVMEKNGLVVRCPSQKDGRCKRLVLTKRARDIHEEVERDIEQFEKQLREGISEEELDTFFRIVDLMTENAKRATPDNKEECPVCGFKDIREE